VASDGLQQRRGSTAGASVSSPIETGERERGNGAALGFHWRRGTFYRVRRSAASIGSVGEAAVDRAPGSAPPSCFSF
jgi:hypothetical protein